METRLLLNVNALLGQDLPRSLLGFIGCVGVVKVRLVTSDNISRVLLSVRLGVGRLGVVRLGGRVASVGVAWRRGNGSRCESG